MLPDSMLTPPFSDQMFFQALKDEKYEEMSKIIESGFDINRTICFEDASSLPTHPLMWAVIRNRIPLTKFLLTNGANVNFSCEGKEGNTPLQIASNNHNLAMIKLLLAYEANIDDDCIMELFIGANSYDPEVKTISGIINLFLKNRFSGQSEKIVEKLNKSSRFRRHPTWEILSKRFLSIWEMQHAILEPGRVLIHNKPLKKQLESWFKNKEKVYFIDCRGNSHYGEIKSYQPLEDDDVSIGIKKTLCLKDITTYLEDEALFKKTSKKGYFIAENEIFFEDKANLFKLDYFKNMFEGFSETEAESIDLSQTFFAEELHLLFSIINNTKHYDNLTFEEAEALIEVADRVTAIDISDQAKERLVKCSDQHFIKALKAEKYEEMTKFLYIGANINQTFNSRVSDYSGYRQLIWGVIQNTVRLLEFLIQKGYGKDIKLGENFSILEIGLLYSLIEKIKPYNSLTFEEAEVLLKVADRVRAFEMFDKATLAGQRDQGFFKALKAEEFETMIKLLEFTSSGHFNSPMLQHVYYRPLMWAVIEKNIPLTEFLLKNGADVNVSCEGKDKNTPLQVASYNHDLAIIKLLLAYKANVDDDCIIQLFEWGNRHNPEKKVSEILNLFLKKGFNDESEKIKKLLSGWENDIRAGLHNNSGLFLKIWREQHFITQPGRFLVQGKPSLKQVESWFNNKEKVYLVKGCSHCDHIINYKPEGQSNPYISFFNGGSLYLSNVTTYLKLKDNSLFVDKDSRLQEKVSLKAKEKIFWVNKSILSKKLPYFNRWFQDAFFDQSKKHLDLSQTFSAEELDVLLFIVDEGDYDALTLEQAQTLAEVANKVDDIEMRNRAQTRIDEPKGNGSIENNW